MKVYRIIALLSLWATLAQTGFVKEKLKENLMVTVKECQEESGASEVDMQTIKAKKIPQTETGLCMMECLFNKVKIMKEGKFNKEGMLIAVTPFLRGDLKKISKMRDFGDKCLEYIGEGSKEKCQDVKLLVECFQRYGKEYGLAIPSP
ncbi:unnamed protein product [Brassicogethes aeneus]|uniref:Uncharacterized protein n=1 Tax=Brassicogethes aeneus TaxID=1431903 RepID=A0A9P0FI40_BRAAE|nr:unnamed protein product [Brassicogethes aeneus]